MRALMPLTMVILVGGAAAAQPDLRFDFGTPESPVAKGWTQVTRADTWDTQKGYGFDPPQTRHFDVPETVPLNDLIRDGVQSTEPFAFRFRVPAGTWWVEVGTGHGRSTRENLYITANDVELLSDLSTRYTSWEGYPTTWSVAGSVPAPDGLITVAFRHEGDASSVLYVRAVPEAARTWEQAKSDARAKPVDFVAQTRREAVIGAIHGGEWERAAQIVRSLEPEFLDLEAAALIRLAGRLEIGKPADRRMAEKAAQVLGSLLRRGQAAADAPRERLLAEQFARGLEYARARSYSFVAARMPGHSKREWIAIEELGKMPAGHPLYYKAQFEIGKIWYWRGREGGRREDYQKAAEHFKRVAEAYPDHRLVRMYLGERVPWGTAYTEGIEGAPRWAALQREALCRTIDVIDYWVLDRQAPNGELGGWWGDDCEMLRWWPVALLAADDDVARTGWRNLADGIWDNSGLLANGFNKGLGDVQHTAEPTSDTQPFLIGAEYGSPVYVERCLQTMKCFRDVWTGVTERGHRHFRSSDISATEVNASPPNAVDVPYAARAVKPGMWAAWYTRLPTLVQLLCEWSVAWNEDAMRTDRGKPRGVPPAAVAFDGDVIGGYGDNWYEPKLYWDYFNFSGGVNLLFEQMLATYGLTGDEQYVRAIEECLKLCAKWDGKLPPNLQPGSEAWAAERLMGQSEAFGKWRLMTGRTDYDDYLSRRGDPYTQYLLRSDTTILENMANGAIGGTKFNFEMLTTEVNYTDRVGVYTGGLFSMYTGGVGNATYYPCYAVSWDGSTKQFAALVLDATDTHLKVLAHSFLPRGNEVQMRIWRLGPGAYRLTIGPDTDSDGRPDQVTTSRQVTIAERGQAVPLGLPSRGLQVIDLTQERAAPPWPEQMPDLAFAPGDLRAEAVPGQPGRVRLVARVHNIGGAEARDVRVGFYLREARPSAPPLGVATVASLRAPLDLDAKTAEAAIECERPTEDVPVVARTWLAGGQTTPEVCSWNNECRLELRGGGR